MTASWPALALLLVVTLVIVNVLVLFRGLRRRVVGAIQAVRAALDQLFPEPNPGHVRCRDCGRWVKERDAVAIDGRWYHIDPCTREVA